MGKKVEVTFGWHIGRDAPDSLLQECSSLFGGHYGVWSAAAGERAGKRVRFPLTKMRELLAGKDARLAVARSGTTLVAYAASVQPCVPGHGTMSWVTQLVVHSEYRHQGIAKQLLFSIWGFSDHFAWGLVTANPYTVRALEKATRRRVSTERIEKELQVILGATSIPYVTPDTETACDRKSARINTHFQVDHSEVPKMIEQVSSSTRWALGELPEGWEWIAFTFRDQPKIALSVDEVQEMLRVSDASTATAYARMTMDGHHAWRQHIAQEVDFIWRECRLSVGCRVLDLGCGDGRHLIALGTKGIYGTGLDYVASRIEMATSKAAAMKLNSRFLSGDARDANLADEFDCVLCLYDVVGSYAEDAENRRIMKTIAKHLRPDGVALISVMNLELTESLSPSTFSVQHEPEKLMDLRASRIMETSGNVFDPRYLMLDGQVVYRKEQFAAGTELPAEILVRDRRFRRSDIESLCSASGLRVLWSRYVQAGRWDTELGATDPKAKEILLLCTNV
jgi:2-polyprenyl-3-methyl-5-hydroxy-6-metoxy-1,4-benzoquinol methylase/GNAT superfamily N-acetyltransferase